MFLQPYCMQMNKDNFIKEGFKIILYKTFIWRNNHIKNPLAQGKQPDRSAIQLAPLDTQKMGKFGLPNKFPFTGVPGWPSLWMWEAPPLGSRQSRILRRRAPPCFPRHLEHFGTATRAGYKTGNLKSTIYSRTFWSWGISFPVSKPADFATSPLSNLIRGMLQRAFWGKPKLPTSAHSLNEPQNGCWWPKKCNFQSWQASEQPPDPTGAQLQSSLDASGWAKSGSTTEGSPFPFFKEGINPEPVCFHFFRHPVLWM